MWVMYLFMVINFESYTWQDKNMYATEQMCNQSLTINQIVLEDKIRAYNINKQKPYMLSGLCVLKKDEMSS